jgi:hypothetical protein
VNRRSKKANGRGSGVVIPSCRSLRGIPGLERPAAIQPTQPARAVEGEKAEHTVDEEGFGGGANHHPQLAGRGTATGQIQLLQTVENPPAIATGHLQHFSRFRWGRNKGGHKLTGWEAGGSLSRGQNRWGSVPPLISPAYSKRLRWLRLGSGRSGLIELLPMYSNPGSLAQRAKKVFLRAGG